MIRIEDQAKFNEEVIRKIIEFEKNIEKILPRLTDTRLNDIESKLDMCNERILEMERMVNKDKLLIDSIHDLKTNVMEIQQEQSSQQNKVNTLTKDLRESTKKFDKIFLENLHLPGIIGESNCRFRHFKDFIEVNACFMFSII